MINVEFGTKVPTVEQLMVLAKQIVSDLPVARVMAVDVMEVAAVLRKVHNAGRACGYDECGCIVEDKE